MKSHYIIFIYRKPEQTKKSKSSKKPITVMPEFRGESMKGVSVNTNIFDGLKFSEQSCLIIEVPI